MQQLSHPETVTVIAVELKPIAGGVSSADSRETFTRLLGGAVALVCAVQPAPRTDGELAFTVVLPDTGQCLAVLRRIESIQDEFKRQYPDIAARCIVHHGLAFAVPQTGGNSGHSYIGSALRSAHSQLYRLPPSFERAATSEFVAATRNWQSCPITFHPLPGEPASQGLMSFDLESAEVLTEPTADAALKQFLVQRLAAYLGPFAEVLVEAAQRSANSPINLIKEVAHEISDIPTRERFTADAMDFLLGGSR